MTINTINIMKDHGIKIPNNISVIDFDNSLIAQYIHLQLTSVRNPIYLMAYCYRFL